MKQIRQKGWLTVLASMMSIAAWAYDAKVNNIYYTFSGEEATVVDMEASHGDRYLGMGACLRIINSHDSHGDRYLGIGACLRIIIVSSRYF